MKIQAQSATVRTLARKFVGLNRSAGLCAFAAFVLVAILAAPASAISYDAPVLWDGVNPSWSFRDTLTSGGEDRSAAHGGGTDIPIMGDWDGDGLDEIGIVRTNPQGALVWYLSGTDSGWEDDPASGWVRSPFAHGGAAQDIPVVGDWNGDGFDTPGLVRNNNNTFQWILTDRHDQTVGDFIFFNHGAASIDIPIVGDWDGDGVDTTNLIRNNGGLAMWILTNNQQAAGSEAFVGNHGAWASDLFVAGDWNSNGQDSIGLYRGGSQNWYLWSDLNNANDIIFQFGDGSETYAFGATQIDIPEPATASLALLGVVSLIARRRRRA